MHKFVLESSPPNVSLLLLEEKHATTVLGVTVVLITCTYRQQEFVRIGYYVNNEIPNNNNINNNDMQQQQDDDDDHESSLLLDHHVVSHGVVRTILADKPRVTRFPIAWDDENDDCTTMTTTTTLYSPFKEQESPSLQSTLCMDNDEQENMAILVSPSSTQTTTTTTAMELS
jgi:hypothetical protein